MLAQCWPLLNIYTCFTYFCSIQLNLCGIRSHFLIFSKFYSLLPMFPQFYWLLPIFGQFGSLFQCPGIKKKSIFLVPNFSVPEGGQCGLEYGFYGSKSMSALCQQIMVLGPLLRAQSEPRVSKSTTFSSSQTWKKPFLWTRTPQIRLAGAT